MGRKKDRARWLYVDWDKSERDITYHYPNRPDGNMIHGFFAYAKLDGKSLIEELKERGYDLRTLKFEICKFPPPPPPSPVMALAGAADVDANGAPVEP